jgi:hypothetical protein
MRYIIKTNDSEVWNKINAWCQQGKLTIVDRGDVVESLKAKIDILKESVDAIKKSGISMNLLKSYIRAETGLSKRDIDTLLSAQDSFFKELGIK